MHIYGEEASIVDTDEVVGAGSSGCGGGAEISLVGGTNGGGGGDGRDSDGDGRLMRCEYTAEKVILGIEPNAPLAYAPGL